ncbi:DEKNAAC101957 [Brettanomyces naardenensis]|uniref:DEKNAAC101957 n=1 Tax=Brettanomyces naardenensis TaxID=13370 RepID=A0A448YJL9_BRENA|nr:DEKNAAC101957 [Brettanomyces naardenensis]
MSFRFSQVLGSEGAGSGTNPPQPKIESNDLQRRRADKRTRGSGRQAFMGSFFSARAANSALSSTSSQLMKNHQPDETYNGKLACPPLGSSSQLTLASGCVTNAIVKDNSTPTLYEVLSKYAVDNYNYKPNTSLGPFARFEKSNIYNIPDRIFQKYNSLDCVTNIGIFSELQKAWLTIDDKLIIWNYKAGSSSSSEQEFYTIDDFKSTILTVALVKPKPKVFVDSVNYLLLVSTSINIHILAVQATSDHLDVSDTKMSVPTQGLMVNRFATYNATGEIFFTGAGDSEGIWRLDYTNNDEWFSRNCSKECLTNSSLSSVLPSVLQKLPSFIAGATGKESKLETVVELKIDQSRGILYTLSSKSIIKTFRLRTDKGKTTLGSKLVKRPFDLLKELSTTTINMDTPLLARNKMKVVNIFPVSKNENTNLFLVAVTDTGCRIFLNGSTLYGDRLTLTASQVKFPPPDAKFYEDLEKKKEQRVIQEQNFVSNGAMPSQAAKSSITKNPVGSLVTVQDLKHAQESSQLLSGLTNTLIISPGIFLGFTKDKHVFSCVPDYGILKNSSQYIEDFEFIDGFGKIHSLVQLTPSFNATNTPSGYCNEFASQYSATPLEFAVLTGTGIHVYRYRTPDLILEDSLDDKTFEEFSKKYGSEEACSSSLYLACKYGKSENFRNLATKYFISGGQNARLSKRLQPTIDDVELSDRFFALVILVARLVRNFWDKEVFQLSPDVRFTRLGYIDLESVKKKKNPKIILQGLSIPKQQLEFFLCSILILVKYFEENRKSIPGLLHGFNQQLDSTSWKEKESEVCLQAEQIGFSSMMKFLNTVKEGLSFLTVLLDEDPKSKNFEKIMNYLSLQSQADLSCLTFNEFFTSSDAYVSRLTKEILSAVINNSIASGNSVELVANTLQEKCGSFCSTGDVLIFKAIESLKKAKDYANNNDQEMMTNYLRAAVKLLKKTSDSLTEETITDCVNIMLQLEYYDGAVEFLLDVANNSDQGKLSARYEGDGKTQMVGELDPKDPKKKKILDHRSNLYQLVFQILADIDKKAILSLEQATENSTTFGAAAFVGRDGQLITQYSQMRDSCYQICLSYKDKMFQYEFYEWFIANGIGEKLLDISTPYILDFLKDYSSKDLEMAKLLWVYYSRREHYYEAAKVLYKLSVSNFAVDLSTRIEFLSRASGFCHCIPPQSLRQEVVALSSEIIDLMAVSNLQDELLLAILQDPRINDAARQNAVASLNGQILTISDLYNDFIDPLGYYELALITFKISDHRNSEDILTKWESLFGKWYIEYKSKPNFANEPFYLELTNKFVLIGTRLNDTDVLFPILDLFQLLAKYIYGGELAGKVRAPAGVIVDAFVKSGVTYGKLYYNLRNIIESTTFEIFDGYTKVLNEEMCYLIHDWYKNDKALRETISDDSVRSLREYSIEKDPIYEYIRATGNPL